jgi:hypothetical protein
MKLKLKHQVYLGYVRYLFRSFFNLFIPNRILAERHVKRSRERIRKLRELHKNMMEPHKKE